MSEFLAYGPMTCSFVTVDGDVVASALPADVCRARGVYPGAPRAVVDTLGAPGQHCWLYSRSPSHGYYRARAVCFENQRVELVVRRWMRE